MIETGTGRSATERAVLVIETDTGRSATERAVLVIETDTGRSATERAATSDRQAQDALLLKELY